MRGMVLNDAKVDWGAAFMVAVLLPVAVDVEGVVAVLTGALDKVAGAGSVPVPVAVAAEAAAADVGASEEDVRTARVLVNVDVGVLVLVARSRGSLLRGRRQALHVCCVWHLVAAPVVRRCTRAAARSASPTRRACFST